MANWQEIKTEYITTDTSYRKLAQKYGLDQATIARRARKEDWVNARQQNASKTSAKIISAANKKRVDRVARIQRAADRLLAKVEKAIDELDRQLAEQIDREKIIEYNNPERPDKPTKEIVKETKHVISVSSIIDRQGLKQIAAALKDIEIVQMLKSDADMREQEARIANLQKQAEKNEESKDVKVEMTDEVVDYCG